jgi:hypothetical protein
VVEFADSRPGFKSYPGFEKEIAERLLSAIDGLGCGGRI